MIRIFQTTLNILWARTVAPILSAALTIALGVVLLTGAAFAQDAPTSSVNILAPLLNELIGLAVVAVSGGVLWIFRWVAKVLKLQSDEQIRGVLYPIIEKGLDIGVMRIREMAGTVRIPQLKNELLNEAIAYIVKSAPDALDHFKISDTQLREMIEARLNVKYPEAIAEPSDQPIPETSPTVPGGSGTP